MSKIDTIKTKTPKTRKKIKNIEYQVNIVFDPRDDIYVARAPELDNCHSHGKTPEEAIANIREAIKLWLDCAKEEGIPIPLPVSRKNYSGKFVLRTSNEIHAKLAHEALRQGKSLNELAVDLIQVGLNKAG